ncbi:ribosomal protein S18-alanine N-acetyltransferase [Evansella cellulosilytica]|uniref:[Ribosomal protein bS18]-alanine N-acetyltransferase n=1 Tax=Evansella cellulosilytica (strain ATCC 21833 / DSM 2522 / FERM P-1141 / JCM 9156 / N-4) TaxID=649639 RepID=E6TVT6_EVAC2|nr:ribosomal protein S18-alanine N-acetyltransferase [Evansella cellulosilytica]ADU28645.1 ribosomal-protein-alanine acetyltransferase [Evansella cellulosilytica DSM 2522]
MGVEVNVRRMDISDLGDVLEVELDAFPNPWSRKAFINELTTNQFAYYIVAVVEGRVVGYAGVWVVIDEAHITNIAVHSAYQRMGIGDLLLKGILEIAKMLGANKATLEVRVSNDKAKSLYEKHGFENGGIRKNYYTDNNEDAQIMWVMLE